MSVRIARSFLVAASILFIGSLVGVAPAGARVCGLRSAPDTMADSDLLIGVENVPRSMVTTAGDAIDAVHVEIVGEDGAFPRPYRDRVSRATIGDSRRRWTGLSGFRLEIWDWTHAPTGAAMGLDLTKYLTHRDTPEITERRLGHSLFARGGPVVYAKRGKAAGRDGEAKRLRCPMVLSQRSTQATAAGTRFFRIEPDAEARRLWRSQGCPIVMHNAALQ